MARMEHDRVSGGVLSVGQLAQRAGLSRSTLLYYDRIGLLEPSGGRRGSGAYRRYTAADARRLERIVSYRAAGVSLAEIARLLAGDDAGGLRAALVERLDAIGAEVAALQEQREVIVALLQQAALDAVDQLDKATWVGVLERAGYGAEEMRRWHLAFEVSAPEEHQRFLEALGIGPREARAIRDAARSGRASNDHDEQ
jgi:DNA-binding transcriptional MerR regulator